MAILLLCLLLSAHVSAQVPTDKEVGNRLPTSTGPELKQLLKQLDLPPEIVDEYSATDIIGFHWFYLNSHSGTSLNVLVLPWASISGAPILLLERSSDHWHLRDQEGMDCHYDDSANVQLAGLTSSKQYDLLLHHDCQARGTGYVEQHTRVLRIVGTHFKQVLDREDVVHAFPPGGRVLSRRVPSCPLRSIPSNKHARPPSMIRTISRLCREFPSLAALSIGMAAAL